MASLITDFLQVFNLDFTLAVFQPEINTVFPCSLLLLEMYERHVCGEGMKCASLGRIVGPFRFTNGRRRIYAVYMVLFSLDMFIFQGLEVYKS